MTVLITGAPGTAGRSRAAGRPDRSVREHIDRTLQAKRRSRHGPRSRSVAYTRPRGR